MFSAHEYSFPETPIIYNQDFVPHGTMIVVPNTMTEQMCISSSHGVSITGIYDVSNSSDMLNINTSSKQECQYKYIHDLIAH